jgi:hypothetical protein
MSAQNEMTEELNCSEGARMLIERMQSHPADFKYEGRFSRIVDQILGKVPVGFSELSDRDKDALTAAFQKYIMEPNLTEYVVDEIFNGDKRRAEAMQQDISNMYSKSLAASMMGTKNQITANMLAGSGFTDPRMALQGGVHTPAQGRVLWTEQEKPSAGRDWFEHEKRILRDMTNRTLAKLKRNKLK